MKIPPVTERRRRERLGLHWTVRLIRRGQDAPVNSETENISSEGFYCLCREPFTAGEELECIIAVPSQSRKDRASLTLECKVRVVRVETNEASGMLGVGFHIETYSVMTTPTDIG